MRDEKLVPYTHSFGNRFWNPKWGWLLLAAKTRPGADCGSDHELLIVKFRLKLKKVGKTTRPFRYDLNQILYDYTVEVTNRFKGLDLIECLKNYGWMESPPTRRVPPRGLRTLRGQPGVPWRYCG